LNAKRQETKLDLTLYLGNLLQVVGYNYINTILVTDSTENMIMKE